MRPYRKSNSRWWLCAGRECVCVCVFVCVCVCVCVYVRACSVVVWKQCGWRAVSQKVCICSYFTNYLVLVDNPPACSIINTIIKCNRLMNYGKSFLTSRGRLFIYSLAFLLNNKSFFMKVSNSSVHCKSWPPAHASLMCLTFILFHKKGKNE